MFGKATVTRTITGDEPMVTLDAAALTQRIGSISHPELKAEPVPVKLLPGGKAMRLQIPRKGQNAWDISVNSALKKPVKAGDTLLLVFQAKLVQGENGVTTTTLPWNSNSLTGPPWSGVVGGPTDIGPDWKMVEIKGKSDKNYAPGALAAGIQLATAKQTVDLGPIIVLDLGQGQ